MFLKTPLGALHRKILALKINVYTIYKRHFIIFQNQRKLFFSMAFIYGVGQFSTSRRHLYSEKSK